MIGPSWVALAKLAEHAYRTGGHLQQDGQVLPNKRPNTVELTFAYAFKYEPGDRVDLLEHDTNHEFEFAEQMMVLWGDRAQELAKRGAQLPDRSRSAEMQAPCRACDAQAGQPCRPLHEGEREPGRWAHPVRNMPFRLGADPGAPRAIALAKRVCLYSFDVARSEAHLLALEVMNAENQRRLGARPGPETDAYLEDFVEHGERMRRAVRTSKTAVENAINSDTAASLEVEWIDMAAGMQLDRIAARINGRGIIVRRAPAEPDDEFRERLRYAYSIAR